MIRGLVSEPGRAITSSLTRGLSGSDYVPNAAAKAYQTATNCSNPRTIALSRFFDGLAALGLDSSLVDGWVLRADSQPASGTTAPSLKGLSNLTITGAPTRHKNGYLLANDSPSAPSVPRYLSGGLPAATSGNVTLVWADFRSGYASISGERTPILAYSSGALTPWLEQNLYGIQSGSNYLGYTYDGAGNFTPVGLPTRGPAEKRYLPVALRNAATGGAASFSGEVKGSSKVSVTGTGSLTLRKIEIGRYSDNGSAWKNYHDGLVPYAFLFSKILSDADLAGLHALIDSYIHPKYRVVIEGDSMSAESVGLAMWIQERSGFFGGNLEVVNLATGGETSAQMVAEIGTSGGIYNQGSTAIPVICTIWAGQNDRLTTGAQTHANCRTLWAAAKALGMKVVAFTITRSDAITVAGWEANRIAANTLIRGDAGTGRYDYLMDADTFIDGLTATDPYYLDTTIYTADKVHLNSVAGGGNSQLMDALYTLIASEIP